MADYIPSTDNELKAWLENFNTKLPAHSATFGITAGQLASVNADQLNFSYWLDQTILFRDEKEERVSYKNSLRDGPIGAPASTPPTAPVIPAAPAAVLPGIVSRMREMVQYIKNHPAYTNSIGQDLDIIGAEQTTQRNSLKPLIKLVKTGAGVEVQWKKSVAHALRIEKQVAGGTGAPNLPAPAGGSWTLLAIDTEPHYMDTTPATTPATWKYRAVYLINDEIAGQWSDEAQISV